jgi:KDO2-lipid IV(A) lauroyltransferase
VLYWLPNRARQTTRRNLRACFPDKTDQEIAGLTRLSLQSTVCTLMEMGKSWLLPLEQTLSLVKESEGLAAFNAAVAANEGVILLAPHLGNWEVFGFFAADSIPSCFMYQPPKLPALDNLLKQTRSRGGIKLAPTNRHGVLQLVRSLQQGEMVGLLPDQVPTDGGGLFAPFFGQQALTMTLVGKLLARRRVPVFCGYAERLSRGRSASC